MSEFNCQRCGNCCRWKGCVKLTDAEIDRIAAYLKLSTIAFLEEYTRLMPDRQGLSLTEKPDGSCIFLMESTPAGCRINPVKPRQCATFPKEWNFPGWQDECPGSGSGE